MDNIIIYTMNNCPYCEKTKRLLTANGYEFNEKRISFNTNEASELIAKTQFFTLPQIFINNDFIGGCSELEVYLKEKDAK